MRMKRVIAVSAAFVIVMAIPRYAESQVRRPKIGLALSGGGAKGCAHAGVLRELEAMHIPVDYIAGTSMGSVIGALYASGMSPDGIEEALETIDWGEALSDATAFQHLTFRRKFEEIRYPSTMEVGIRNGKLVIPSGIRTGQKLSFLLARFLLPHLDQSDFSKLPIPFAAVATDLETGEPAVLTSGDLAEAVRASMSIPGAFTPVHWNGKILVDGGVVMNIPVDVVRKMGADIVIAVDIASPLSKREDLGSTLGVLGQLSSFLTRGNMGPQLAKADLVLSPDVQGYGLYEFKKAPEIAKKGADEAIAKRAELAKYAIDPAEHKALVDSRHVPRTRNVMIDDIKVEGIGFVDEAFIEGQMKTKPGEPLDLDKLQKDVEWMYGWGDFVGIHAGLEEVDGKHTLLMRVEEKSWGPSYFRTGITLETRYNKPTVSLLFNFTKRWLNERGAEWRSDLEFGRDWGLGTELYQPRGYDKVGFFAGGIAYRRRSLRLFDGPSALADYDIRQFVVRADGGVQLRTAGEFRLGLFQRWNDAKIEVGLPNYPTVHNSEAGVRAGLNLNTTDEPFFPSHGVRLGFEALAPLEALGAERDYLAASLSSAFFGSYGRHVFTAGIGAHDVSGASVPVYDQALLGGLGNLGGYAYGELLGNASTIVSVGYRNRLTKIPGLSKGIYAGVIAEAGDVYASLSDVKFGDMRTSVTLYIGMDTSYGPLILGAGKASNHEAQWYMQIGRSF
jgi:NTE family protein